MAPTFGNGKICYIEMPATDVARSAEFYERVFAWTIRKGGDGSMSFDDGVGEVSGAWVTGRAPAATPGLMVHIMVDSMEVTLEAVVKNGGEITQPVGADAPEITARFRDPGGNIMGLYQHRG
ncbi:MAG TPA: VOC family protein [Candidatus Acidoferrum sp.]